MVKLFFCSFADEKNMKYSRLRIHKQAEEMQVFDGGIYTYSEKDLDPDFQKHFQDKLKPEVRGFGYWVWKPHVILKTLEKMQEGDLLLYADAGCHLNRRGRKRLLDYFEQTKNSPQGLVCFSISRSADKKIDRYDEIKHHPWLEKNWTKMDLFTYFGIDAQNKITTQTQKVATVIFCTKNAFCIDFIKSWLKVFYDDFSLVDDSPSKSPNFPDFIRHKHDQSIFSLLCATRNVTSFISGSESHSPDFKKLRDYPIHFKYDRRAKPYSLRIFFNSMKHFLSSIYPLRVTYKFFKNLFKKQTSQKIL